MMPPPPPKSVTLENSLRQRLDRRWSMLGTVREYRWLFETLSIANIAVINDTNCCFVALMLLDYGESKCVDDGAIEFSPY